MIALRQVLGGLCDYFGLARRGRHVSVADPAGLRHFLETRASHVAQTALYGYVRTRAGTRFPELFENDTFVESLNIAKWQVWLACLSDLAVYAGGLLANGTPASGARVGEVVAEAVEGALAAAGTPPDAGADFEAGVARVRDRLAQTDWAAVTDDEAPFAESPEALIEWAPIVDDLKQYDTEIVRNSVRFRWQEVRRDLRRDLNAEAVMAAASGRGMPDEGHQTH
jgi:hypothetical protein